MDKQTQCCCICLEDVCNCKTLQPHQFSCCANIMHAACFEMFRKSKASGRCPYCRHKTRIKYTHMITEDDIENGNYSILDFM